MKKKEKNLQKGLHYRLEQEIGDISKQVLPEKKLGLVPRRPKGAENSFFCWETIYKVMDEIRANNPEYLTELKGRK